MENFLYAEVSSTDFMLLPVSSVIAMDGTSATNVDIYYKNLEADNTDATADDMLPKISVTVTTGEAKQYLKDLTQAMNMNSKNHTGFIDLEALPTAGTVASISIVPA
tara:strand:- start:1592 stop:1912 length:321 start_codon:yes stop_codon:yes gene_type:complete